MKRYLILILLNIFSLRFFPLPGSALFADEVTKSHSEEQGNKKLPLLDRASILNSLPWVINILNLHKHGYKNFQIQSFEISPDQRYAVINISNGKSQDTPGPFHRFVVCNPKSKEIFFPPMEMLISENLGYPYIAAKFAADNRLAIAYGYRSVMASVVSLPSGKILEKREINVFETNLIEQVLSKLLQ
jgi:hypothetical protein